jgi:hypothetical protein
LWRSLEVGSTGDRNDVEERSVRAMAFACLRIREDLTSKSTTQGRSTNAQKLVLGEEGGREGGGDDLN